MTIDYLVEVWDWNRNDWFLLIDFIAGLPLGTIIVDAYERLTLAEAQFRQADLTNRSQGTKFKKTAYSQLIKMAVCLMARHC
jgi:hypothetical protein